MKTNNVEELINTLDLNKQKCHYCNKFFNIDKQYRDTHSASIRFKSDPIWECNTCFKKRMARSWPRAKDVYDD